MSEPKHKSDSTYWRSNAGDCRWARYSDACVIFHMPSGKTHVLNIESDRLLTEILHRPESTASIAAKLLGMAEDEVAADKFEEVRALLVQFEYLGLVDRSVNPS